MSTARSLHVRLLFTLLVILVPAGALFVAAALGSARAYYQEVTQRQNVDLAHNLLVDGVGPGGGDTIAEEELDELVSMMAMANPGVEIYLVDAEGSVTHAKVDGDVVATQVDVAAIERLLRVADGSGRLPVLGTDPRRGGHVIFSAAPLQGGGYLYVVLTDESRTTLLRSVQTSTTLALVLWGGGIGLAVVMSVGAVAFTQLTRRLRALHAEVRRFDPAEGEPRIAEHAPPRDEIDELASGFVSLGRRVRAQIDALADADRARRELVTNVSHDLRTPLTALRASLEAAAEPAAPQVDPEVAVEARERHLEIARRSAERLGRMIDQLFELSVLDASEAPLQCEPFPVAELVQDVVQKFEERARSQGVALRSMSGDARPVALADIGQVERALSNLLDNALRHTPAGGQVSVSARLDGAAVRIEVRDTGDGIDRADHERVFERLYRVEGGRSGEGTGLGLAIVRRVVELHGGAVHLESEPGEGARFSFTLPVAPSA